MKQTVMSIGLAVTATLGLGGCGSSSGGSNTVTGEFIDAAVAGLHYVCSSGENGTTDSNGRFTCPSGDTVTFSINGFVIGTAGAADIVSPRSLYPTDGQKAIDVAQLLQTLDSDNNPDNGITIEQSGAQFEAMGNAEGNVTVGQADFDSRMGSYLGKTMVDEATAQEHMDSNVLESRLAGKTLYTTIYEQNGTLESWAFSADLTSATWTELVGGNDSGSGTITVDGMTIVYSDTEGSTTLTVQAINDDYLLIDVDGERTLRLYFDKAAAETYFHVGEPIVYTVPFLTPAADTFDTQSPAYRDTKDDVAMSGLDIVDVKMAYDANNLYIRLDRAGLDFPASGLYYNYWIYFRAGDSTFSIENFHDGNGNHSLRVWEGIGYADSQSWVWEKTLPASQTSTALDLVIPRSASSKINTSATYTVSLFSHYMLNDGSWPSNGEAEDDSTFTVDFAQP